MGYDDRYDPDTDFDRWYTKGTGAAIVRFLRPGQTVLELGCATGAMTAQFVEAGVSVLAVDRSAPYLERARARHLAGVEFVEGDISTLVLDRTFDHVVAANVAHEVPDLPSFLGACARHVAVDGHVHVSLQNPQSLHRLLGRAMGMIDDLKAVSARGERFETLRLLDADDLAAEATSVGLRCVHREGVMVKPLANAGMSALGDDVLEGFIELAADLPDHCAMNYLVFRR
jgi:2-polyprenyl-3-methyl-5-hydroxy-6-metoxy-1,4-benzoquinol methylase